MDTKSYLSFAEDDYSFLCDCGKSGMLYNGMAAIAQNCCEKFLKYLIDEYYLPANKEDANNKVNVLRAHSLRKLLNYIEENMGFDIDNKTRTSILKSDGYYFTSRYPGEDSIKVGKKDMDDCYEAIDTCRQFVMEIDLKLQEEKIQRIKTEEEKDDIEERE